ncbi:hypothetical protein C8A05DRAFT_39240 [Staphylotrichum tortipilum]|uniref:Uncharacterized protein n=1 Tax=Staphylotrichum tortipilum TaxID=2831512 RepID=A0AAN6RNQ7_9PEZI|nr:hypothetical protein C8A05DRAFT_39240 [Staphylotrichum longicolle]
MSPTPSITASDSMDEWDVLDDPTQPPSRRRPVQPPRPPNRSPGVTGNGLSHYYAVRFDTSPDADAGEINHTRAVAFGGGVGWVVNNFRPRDGFKHWRAQDEFPHDVTYPNGGGGGSSTIPARDLHLWYVARARDGNSGGGGGGGMACVALMASPPAPEGFPDEWIERLEERLLWPEGSLAGTPAMRTVEGALLAYLRGLRDIRSPGRRAVLAETVEGGWLVEPPAEMEFAPSRIDQKEQLVEIYNIERELLSDIAGITDLREIAAQIGGAE